MIAWGLHGGARPGSWWAPYSETMIINVFEELCTIQEIWCRFVPIKRWVVADLADGVGSLPKRADLEITQVLTVMVKKTNRNQNHSGTGLVACLGQTKRSGKTVDQRKGSTDPS